MLVAPSSQTVEVTFTAVFYAIVDGVGSKEFKYQWYHNGTIISGENEKNIVITNMTESKTGKYECVVTNCCNNTNKSGGILMISSELCYYQPLKCYEYIRWLLLV